MSKCEYNLQTSSDTTIKVHIYTVQTWLSSTSTMAIILQQYNPQTSFYNKNGWNCELDIGW